MRQNLVASPRIVLAEDDQTFRSMLRRCLTADGYDVLEVSSGDRLMAVLENALEQGLRPAMVVSDQRMPGMPGLGAMARARSWGWRLPFLLITAFGDDSLQETADGLHVMMMSKPFDLDDFRTIVRLHVDRSGLRCVTCGGTTGLRTVDDAMEVAFCEECRELLQDLDDPSVDLGRAG